ncbi:hypothetical protein Hanom_Chr13g01223661 [Helianthus anomalus]
MSACCWYTFCERDSARFDSVRFNLVSTRLGPAQARRHDIPPSCAPEFDTRSTESREPIPFTHHHDDVTC